jgi:hypothetical protein
MKKETLQKKWIHSHEEDTDTEMVFRPAGYNFPPSRGRQSFALNADGTMIKGGIAPTDGTVESEGRWEVEGDKISFYVGSRSKPTRTLNIVSVTPDKLVVKK